MVWGCLWGPPELSLGSDRRLPLSVLSQLPLVAEAEGADLLGLAWLGVPVFGAGSGWVMLVVGTAGVTRLAVSTSVSEE